jgi:hypothetical protein
MIVPRSPNAGNAPHRLGSRPPPTRNRLIGSAASHPLRRRWRCVPGKRMPAAFVALGSAHDRPISDWQGHRLLSAYRVLLPAPRVHRAAAHGRYPLVCCHPTPPLGRAGESPLWLPTINCCPTEAQYRVYQRHKDSPSVPCSTHVHHALIQMMTATPMTYTLNQSNGCSASLNSLWVLHVRPGNRWARTGQVPMNCIGAHELDKCARTGYPSADLSPPPKEMRMLRNRRLVRRRRTGLNTCY